MRLFEGNMEDIASALGLVVGPDWRREIVYVDGHPHISLHAVNKIILAIIAEGEGDNGIQH